MALTTEQLDFYKREGYLVVPDVFDAATMQAALAECERIYYGCRYEDVLKDYDTDGESAVLLSRLRKEQGRIQFPCGASALDTIVENETYLNAFSACLGSDDISYSNAHLFVRCGLNDVRHPAYHTDNDTNTFLPPHHENAAYEYVNSWVFLHDVDEDGAPSLSFPALISLCPGF